MTSTKYSTASAGAAGSAAADDAGRLDALRQMLRIRIAEERVLALRKEGKAEGSVHVCVGQESAPVGVVAELDERDRVLATYRGHGWALACGVPIAELLAEIIGRRTGTNGGRAGSPYLSSPQHRFVGENSIVGAGLPIANGVAMGLVERGAGGVAVVSFGDGATNQGGVHEAIVFAIARELPVVFVCENNEWSEMTPIRATVPNTSLSERARGYGLPAAMVDGSDVLAVRRAAAEAVQRGRDGGGPSFIEVQVPRLLGHYNGDIEHYRTADDRALHAERDPIASLSRALLADAVLDEAGLDELRQKASAEVATAEAEALAAPLPDPDTAATEVTAEGAVSTAPPLPTSGKELTYGLAVNTALRLELEQRPEVVLFGEDIAIPGGTFGVTRNLRKLYGERVFDTPISEAAILGAAVGSSMEGLRPIVEIMWIDFAFVAFDQLVNQAANVRYLSRGRVSAPLVVRTQQGVTPGSCAQHSQSMEALLAHIPGLKVGLPSSPHDAYAMLRAAIADPDPVIIIESRAQYQAVGPVDLDAPVEAVGGARLRRDGKDVLLVTWGSLTATVLEAADDLAARGVQASVLDLRWVAPLDEAAIATELERCGGKLLIAHEANVTGGFGAEVAARIAERHFHQLDGPIVRIGLPDVPMPSAVNLQQELVPSVSKIVEAAARLAAM